MATKLTNQVALGLHLSAGASDGYLVSAADILDETKSQTVQATLDDIYSKSEVDAKIANGGTFDSSQYYTKTEVDGKFGNLTIDSEITSGTTTITTTDSHIEIPDPVTLSGDVILGGDDNTTVQIDGLVEINGVQLTNATLAALKTIADKIAEGYSVVFVKDTTETTVA